MDHLDLTCCQGIGDGGNGVVHRCTDQTANEGGAGNSTGHSAGIQCIGDVYSNGVVCICTQDAANISIADPLGIGVCSRPNIVHSQVAGVVSNDTADVGADIHSYILSDLDTTDSGVAGCVCNQTCGGTAAAAAAEQAAVNGHILNECVVNVCKKCGVTGACICKTGNRVALTVEHAAEGSDLGADGRPCVHAFCKRRTGKEVSSVHTVVECDVRTQLNGLTCEVLGL